MKSEAAHGDRTADPIDEIARLLRQASGRVGGSLSAAENVGRSMRLWAIDVAEEAVEACPHLTGEADPTTAARVISAARTEALAEYDEHDEMAVEIVLRDLDRAISVIASEEQVEPSIHACTREAMAALRAAAQDPYVYDDLRGLAIRFSVVAEHAALAIAYRDPPRALARPPAPPELSADPHLAELADRINSLRGVDADVENFFRRPNPRLDIRIAEVRREAGARWLGMLRARLDAATDSTEEDRA